MCKNKLAIDIEHCILCQAATTAHIIQRCIVEKRANEKEEEETNGWCQVNNNTEKLGRSIKKCVTYSEYNCREMHAIHTADPEAIQCKVAHNLHRKNRKFCW